MLRVGSDSVYPRCGLIVAFLMRQGEEATEAFTIVSGVVELVEIGRHNPAVAGFPPNKPRRIEENDRGYVRSSRDPGSAAHHSASP